MRFTPNRLAGYAGFALAVMLAIEGFDGEPHQIAVAAISAATAASGEAAEAKGAGALGVYLDHRGDGAVEFADCGGKLCGRVVWVRQGLPADACGKEVIGSVARIREGVWDGGWILDPEIDQKFDVEISKLSDEEIQVLGYLGSKDLSETFVWKKAPQGLVKCTVQRDVALVPGK
ncbi:MAG: DUF2147 domain-containing protein [Alphaproteobacteria bacterium]|nr:DUF2147 domain-containing protein [Alphaproteobacteria bacterium]